MTGKAHKGNPKAKIGGILILTGGLVSLYFGLMVSSNFFLSYLYGGGWLACGIISIILSGFALIGGLSAVKQWNWGLSIFGSVCVILTLNLISMILGGIGLALIFLSYDDFKL